MCPAINPHNDDVQADAGRTVLPPNHSDTVQLPSSDAIAYGGTVYHTVQMVVVRV